jgi:hypothetical protein
MSHAIIIAFEFFSRREALRGKSIEQSGIKGNDVRVIAKFQLMVMMRLSRLYNVSL